jgi:hypothetical protein
MRVGLQLPAHALLNEHFKYTVVWFQIASTVVWFQIASTVVWFQIASTVVSDRKYTVVSDRKYTVVSDRNYTVIWFQIACFRIENLSHFWAAHITFLSTFQIVKRSKVIDQVWITGRRVDSGGPVKISWVWISACASRLQLRQQQLSGLPWLHRRRWSG